MATIIKEIDFGKGVKRYGQVFYSRGDLEQYEQQQKIKKFLKILDQVDEERKGFLESFDKRIETLSLHQNYIYKLNSQIEQYKKEGKNFDDIVKTIQDIRKDILKVFEKTLGKEVGLSEEEKKRIPDVKRVRSEIYTVRQYDYEKLRQLYKERTLGAEESKKHVLAMMQSVQEGMQRERIDMEIEEHLSSILNELDIVIEQQREYIDSESKLLSALHAIMGNREYRVRDADIIIKEVVKNFEGLKGALAGEKIRVAMPFEKFLQHKRTIKERTEAYQEKGMITKEEIFRDLRTMRTASEAAAYINWLSKFLMAMIRNPEISEKEKAQLQRLWGWLSRANQKAIEKTEINLNYQKRISERDDKFDILGKRAFYAKLSDLIYKYEKGTRAAKKKKKIESILENLNIAEEKKDAGNLRFTMAVFDIDNFKTYNDFYNYEIGDDVIRKIIDLVKKSVQKTDFFAKYGGEEFAIIFEGIEKEKILNRIDQIRDHIFRNTIYFMQKINNKFRQKIESEFHKEIAIQGLDEFLSFSNLVKKVANMDRGAKIPMPYVSVSIGIAEFPKDAHTAKGIKKEAEELQKKAKETGYNFWNIRFSGRNQVCIKTDGKIKCLNPENSIYKKAGEIKKAA